MSEISKTGIYAAVAVVVAAIALVTQPSTSRFDVQTMVGEPLLDEEFAVDAPKRLSITRVDAETGERADFEVAEQDGLWSIPSKGGYPADATERMVAAVEGLADREIFQVLTDEPGRHAEYGVLDPVTSEALDAESVGTRVKLADADDKLLADIIVGKEVKDTDGEQHYVRLASQDAVYAVAIDLANFTTNFDDWIEKDLLKLNTLDIQSLGINDYSASMDIRLDGGQLRPVVTLDQRSRFELSYDEENSKWNAESLEVFDRDAGGWAPLELGLSQEIDADVLRELRNALDDLKIVDVDRKPAGLSADLKAGADFLNERNLETIESLGSRGFLPLPMQDGIEILSSDGELVVTLKNGVEYVLRFGNLQSADGTTGDAPAGEEATDGDETLSRYLFVMVRFNESAIEKPELEELPPLPAEPTTTEEADGDADATAEEGEATDDEQPEGDEQEEAESDGVDADTIAQIRAQRAVIEDRNKSALKLYEDKLADGREKVEELNLRFGDWYYVIGNDVFNKIHLDRDQVIKQTEAEDAPGDAGNGGGGVIPGLPNFGAPGTSIPGLPDLTLPSDDSPADESAPDTTESDTGDSTGDANGAAEEDAPADESDDAAAEPEATTAEEE